MSLLLHREGVLEDMSQHGVECVDCISVDNALVRLGDPLFAGYCHEKGAECGVWPDFHNGASTLHCAMRSNMCAHIRRHAEAMQIARQSGYDRLESESRLWALGCFQKSFIVVASQSAAVVMAVMALLAADP